jgi:hypothetical protein
MVNLSKLMIGDWVETNPSYGKLACGIKSNIARVSEIGFSNSDGMYVSFDGIKGRYYDAEIEPIPLTEEILEKNGFKKNKFNQYVLGKSYLGEKIYYEIGVEIGFIQLCYPLRYPNSYYSILSIGYVHEFQHMLNIFGIKKEIKL